MQVRFSWCGPENAADWLFVKGVGISLLKMSWVARLYNLEHLWSHAVSVYACLFIWDFRDTRGRCRYWITVHNSDWTCWKLLMCVKSWNKSNHSTPTVCWPQQRPSGYLQIQAGRLSESGGWHDETFSYCTFWIPICNTHSHLRPRESRSFIT